MNTLALVSDDHKRDTVIEQLQRESGGSFAIVYKALQTVSSRSNTTTATGASLSKNDVLVEIQRLRNKASHKQK